MLIPLCGCQRGDFEVPNDIRREYRVLVGTANTNRSVLQAETREVDRRNSFGISEALSIHPADSSDEIDLTISSVLRGDHIVIADVLCSG